MAKNTSRRGASRGGSKKQSRQVPGWVWLFTGVIGGLFVAFLFHLAQVQMEQGRTGGGEHRLLLVLLERAAHQPLEALIHRMPLGRAAAPHATA